MHNSVWSQKNDKMCMEKMSRDTDFRSQISGIEEKKKKLTEDVFCIV